MGNQILSNRINTCFLKEAHVGLDLIFKFTDPSLMLGFRFHIHHKPENGNMSWRYSASFCKSHMSKANSGIIRSSWMNNSSTFRWVPRGRILLMSTGSPSILPVLAITLGMWIRHEFLEFGILLPLLVVPQLYLYSPPLLFIDWPCVIVEYVAGVMSVTHPLLVKTPKS